MTVAVSRSEASMLAAARAVVQASPRAEVEHLLLAKAAAPERLSPSAMGVLTRTLSTGMVTWLARAGAARQQGGQRLWARQAPPALHFSTESMRLLQWLVSTPLAAHDSSPLRFTAPLSGADELLLLGALAAAVGTPAERTVSLQEPVRSSALCALAFPAVLARWAALPAVPAPRLGPGQAHDFAIEALQGALATWWRHGARLTRSPVPADVIRIGQTQRLALTTLIAAADAAQRRGLLGFVLEATAHLLGPHPTAADWVDTFDERLPMRERSEARKAAGALLEAAVALRTWDTEARAVRFIDDGYAEAQARVKHWELSFGEQRFRQAEAVLRELASLTG